MNTASLIINSMRKRGFTLLEALVAITILTLAVAGPFYAASLVLNTVLVASDRIAASYLAQEGLEYVRSMRDATFLTDLETGSPNANSNEFFYTDFLGASMASSIGTCIGAAGDGSFPCALDPGLSMGTGLNSALQVCTNSDCSDKPLFLKDGIYSLNSSNATTTPFTRMIQFYNGGNTSYPNAVEVVVTVSWFEHGQAYSVNATDEIFPWI